MQFAGNNAVRTDTDSGWIERLVVEQLGVSDGNSQSSLRYVLLLLNCCHQMLQICRIHPKRQLWRLLYDNRANCIECIYSSIIRSLCFLPKEGDMKSLMVLNRQLPNLKLKSKVVVNREQWRPEEENCQFLILCILNNIQPI